MRLMGIDYGSKRVGVSVSDESGQMAFPEVVLSNDSDLLKNLVALIEDKGVEEVVVGHSLNRDGSENKIHSEVEELMEDLTLELGLPIHLEPEQYSTKEAEQIQGRNDMVDASAATIILNSYITKKKI
tara:strand:- start:1 stop:384 length:384 start_codon:yes stop_codon:yes gene_type:complete